MRCFSLLLLLEIYFLRGALEGAVEEIGKGQEVVKSAE